MNLRNTFSTLLLLVTAPYAICQNGAAQFVQGDDPCIFPVELYLSKNCKEFWSNGKVELIADGRCHSIPPSKYTDKVDPGPYYRAVCDRTGGKIKFLAAECDNAACTQCEQYSAYKHGPTNGTFDMEFLGCQDLTLSSFVSFGPTQVKTDTDAPVRTSSPGLRPTPRPTRRPTPRPTPAPVVPADLCRWSIRYFDRSNLATTTDTCDVFNLVAAQQRANIIADGKCRNSGIQSIGYYRAVCTRNNGIMFLKNKCSDASCQNCEATPDVYRGTGYRSGTCYGHRVEPKKAWALTGTCSQSSCVTYTNPNTENAQLRSSHTFSELP